MNPVPEKTSALQQPGTGKMIKFTLLLSVALALSGLGTFYYATRTAQGPQRGTVHKVVVNDSTCEPADFKLPAGVTTFEIHNASRRPLEWEILDGVMVLAERENIAPGFHSLLTVKLKPGTFAITCGLLSNPRGSLQVTPTQDSEAERLRPPIQAFISPLSESRVFLLVQSAALVREMQALADAVAVGDLALAQQQWLAARQPYKRIELVAGRLADLEARIDPVAEYLAQQEADTGFVGFHRLEKMLFEQQSLNGAETVVQPLLEDVQALQKHLTALQQKPEDLIGNAVWLVQRLQEGTLQKGENPYAQSDLSDLAANLQGIEKSVLLLDSLLQGAQPALAGRVHSQFAMLQQILATLRMPGQDMYLPYAQITPEQRGQLLHQLALLTEVLVQINPALGLE